MREGEKAESCAAQVINITDTDTPLQALNAANFLLKEYGVEFINHATDSDYYCFSLQPIATKKG